MFGQRPDREQRVRAVDRAAVVARDEHLVALAPDRDRARALQQLHAPPDELVLEHGRDFGVLGRQHLLARHDQRDLRAERAEHVRELDAGDAGTDHHEMLGDLGRRVRLAGREDALAVDRSSSRAHAAAIRSRAGSRRLRSPRRRRRWSASTAYAPSSRPVPRSRRTPCDSSRLVTPVAQRLLHARDARRAARARRGSPSASSPIVLRARELGEPVAGRRPSPCSGCSPRGARRRRSMSRSISVTSAPSDAATVAAVFPPGPPPMITKRTGTTSRLRAAARLP